MKQLFFIVAAFAAVTASAQVAEDFKPATTNQEGHQYPMVNSQRMVRAQISAPEANSVKLDIGGVKYDLVKNAEGVWTGESAPQDEGFHYYQLNIDGASVPDPGSLYYYGASRWGSGIDIPAADEDFYTVKNVPQGSVNEVYYYSTVTEKMRHCYVYLPAAWARRRAIRSLVSGCVLKSLLMVEPIPLKGLMMNICAVAGVASLICRPFKA